MDTHQALSIIGHHLAHTAPFAAGLAVFVTTIAYIHNARLKALVFSIPIPFSLAYLVTNLNGSRLPVNPTHVTGLVLSVTYHWVVYLVRVRLKAPLPVAMAAGLAVFLGVAPQLMPLRSESFPLVIGLVALAWAGAASLYRPRHQEGQRSGAPVWVKAPGVFLIAVVVYNLTPLLGGGVTGFPYAGLFTSYEMRRSLRTLAGQYTINFGALLLMLLTIWLLQGRVGAYWALAAGVGVAASGLLTIYWRGIGKPAPEIPTSPGPHESDTDPVL